jgi:hypothetical protein
MTQTEALRLALEALEDLGMKHYESTGEVLYKETFTAIKAALEAKDEPYALEASMFSNDRVKVDPVTGNVSIGTPQQEAKDEPVGTLQEPTVERAWFTIAELNAWADKKLLENPQWVMPKDEPERDEPPPQRTWVGLTDAEVDQAFTELTLRKIYQAIEAKLREKNNA